MELVKITHDKAGTCEVPASAVKHWERAGWKRAEKEDARPSAKEGKGVK